MKIKIIVLLLCFAASLFAQDLGRETRVDSVLASVNGEPVTLLDVMLETSREEMRLASLYSGDRLYRETAALRRKILEEIVIRKLVYEVYKKKPFPIEEQYIEQIVDMLVVSMGDGSRQGFLRRLRELETDISEIRKKAKEKIAVDVLLREFCDRPVYITPKEIYECYVREKSKYVTPARYDLFLLQILRKEGKAGEEFQKRCQEIGSLLKKVQGREAFERLVKNFSDAPNAQNGGGVGLVDEDDLRPEFAPVVKKMKAGESTGPVEAPEGSYFIYLNKILPEEIIPFSKASGEIRQELEFQERERVRKAYGEKLKQQAIIRYYF